MLAQKKLRKVRTSAAERAKIEKLESEANFLEKIRQWECDSPENRPSLRELAKQTGQTLGKLQYALRNRAQRAEKIAIQLELAKHATDPMLKNGAQVHKAIGSKLVSLRTAQRACFGVRKRIRANRIRVKREFRYKSHEEMMSWASNGANVERFLNWIQR